MKLKRENMTSHNSRLNRQMAIVWPTSASKVSYASGFATSCTVFLRTVGVMWNTKWEIWNPKEEIWNTKWEILNSKGET